MIRRRCARRRWVLGVALLAAQVVGVAEAGQDPQHEITVRTSSLALAVDGESEVAILFESTQSAPAEVRVASIRSRDDSVLFALPVLQPFVLQPSRATAVHVRAQNVSTRPWSPGTPARPVELDVVLQVTDLPASEPRAEPSPPAREVRLARALELTLMPAPGPSVLVTAPRRVDVPAGREVEVPISVESRVGWASLEVRCAIDGQAQPTLTLPPRGEGAFAILQRNEAGSERLGPADRKSRDIDRAGSCAITAVTADGARLDRGVERLSLRYTMFWKVGTSPIAVLVVALSGLFASFLWVREIRPRFTTPSLLGRLVVYAGPGAFRRVTVPLRGRTRLALEAIAGAGEGGGVRVEGDRVVLPGGEVAAVELYAEKSGKRNVMRLRALSGASVRLAEGPLGPAPVVVKRGRARFSIGPYSCRID